MKSNYKSERGGDYTPGTTPVCDDWDGGKIECGKGYHLSPHLMMTKEFCRPDKFIAGWVSLSDMAVHPDGKSAEMQNPQIHIAGVGMRHRRQAGSGRC